MSFKKHRRYISTATVKIFCDNTVTSELKKFSMIFLHGLWRSGSTYIWSRFRDDVNAYCYYEPLNNGIGKLSIKKIQKHTKSVLQSNNHPVMSSPYFAEYEPLVKQTLVNKGVKYFDKSFGVKNYVLMPHDKCIKLRRYLDYLIEYASSQNKMPVMGFNRTCLRLPKLTQIYPHAFNIYIDRDPRLVWRSYKEQMTKGNYTFFEGWLTIIENNTHHPLIKHFTEDVKTRKMFEKILYKRKKYYHNLIDELDDELTYKIIFKFWYLSTLMALSVSDLIIDMELMAENDHREKIRRKILDNTLIELNFDNFRSKKVPATNDTVNWDIVEQQSISEMDQVFKLITFDLERFSYLSQLSPRKQALLECIGSF